MDHEHEAREAWLSRFGGAIHGDESQRHYVVHLHFPAPRKRVWVPLSIVALIALLWLV